MVNRIAENVPILNDDEKTANRYGSTETNKDHWHESRLSYPRAVIFVLASKFFEAFAANGVRTVLALYLRDSLKFSEESATSFYHIFNFFSQFCPIFGAVLADSYFGNAKTIFYLNFLYAIGWIGMVTLTFPLGNISIAPFVLLSLILISIGNGSIRACITSLGGSQFKLPQQSHQLDRYFSHYYFIYTMGIMLSKVFPPSIRSHAKCFGANECYTAVFGALGVIFLISWLVFLVGFFYYEHEDINRSDGNVLFQVIGCIFAGATKRIRGCYFDRITDNSWIDGAIGKYTESFVTDVAAFLRVLKLFLPLPIYWALFAQIDSSWTFQASQLNTTVFGFEFEADQAKAMGASMLLIMIPVWQNAIVPMILLWKVEIDPLTSVMFGGICASLSFVCSGILQVMIDQNGLKWFSILWQLPQFFLIMMGEVLLSIPGLQFAFTQAPPSMKSVMTAAWFCNNAFGNLIVVFVTEVKIIKSQSGQYFLYATLMLVGILIFRWLAVCYRYSETYDEETSLMPNKRKHSTQSVDYFRSQENLDLIL